MVAYLLLMRHWIAEQGMRLVLLWGMTLGATLFSTQWYTDYHLPITTRLNLDVDGVSQPGFGDRTAFRFTAAYTSLALPNLNRANHLLRVRLHNGMPSGRTLQILTDAMPIAVVQLRPGWQNLAVYVPATGISRWDVTHLILLTQPGPGQASNVAGMPIAQLELEQLQAGTLSERRLAQMLACITLLEILLLLAGLPRSEALLIDAMILFGLALASARWTVQTGTLLPIAIATLAQGIGLAALGHVFLRARRAADRAWHAPAIMASVGLFFIHSLGMHAPQFVTIDHTARAHSLLQIAMGQGDIVLAKLARQYEWGLNSVPYSLLSYQMLTPLVWLIPQASQLDQVVRIVISLIDAVVPLLLYRLVRSESGSARTGAFAALLYAALPVTHLYFHDGSYPTILGAWVSVTALLALTRLIKATTPQALWGWFVISTSALVWAMLMYVVQIVFLPVTIGGIGLGMLLLGGASERRGGWRVLGTIALAFAAALVLFYGAYLWPLAVEIGAQLARGTRPGYDSGLLPGPLVGSFWQQAWGHTRWLPLPLALVGFGLAARRHQRTLAFVGFGYGLLLAVMTLVDVHFSLWNNITTRSCEPS